MGHLIVLYAFLFSFSAFAMVRVEGENRGRIFFCGSWADFAFRLCIFLCIYSFTYSFICSFIIFVSSLAIFFPLPISTSSLPLRVQP